MPRDEVIRLVMHLPNGMFAGWAMFGFPLPRLVPIEPTWLSFGIGLAVLFVFLIYQVFNEWRKADHSWKDIQGIAWGLVISVAVLGILWRLK